LPRRASALGGLRSRLTIARRWEPECPVEAIYPEDEVPEEMDSYISRAVGFDHSGMRPS
jgi:hypothetical protein